MSSSRELAYSRTWCRIGSHHKFRECRVWWMMRRKRNSQRYSSAFCPSLHKFSHIRWQREIRTTRELSTQIELGDRLVPWRFVRWKDNGESDSLCVPKVPLLRLARPGSARRGDATTGARSQILQGRSECFSIQWILQMWQLESFKRRKFNQHKVVVFYGSGRRKNKSLAPLKTPDGLPSRWFR